MKTKKREREREREREGQREGTKLKKQEARLKWRLEKEKRREREKRTNGNSINISSEIAQRKKYVHTYVRKSECTHAGPYCTATIQRYCDRRPRIDKGGTRLLKRLAEVDDPSI